MTDNFMSALAQIAKSNGGNDTSNNLNISNIYMQVHSISNDETGITYATGLNMVTGENTKVRLSTIDESAQDLILMKKEQSLVNAKHKITTLYAGHKPREELITKRDKRRANFLFFDRCFALGDINGIPAYRSHWANTITQQQSIETVTGYVNFQLKDERKSPNGKIRAWANVIEYCRHLSPDDKTKNFEMFTYALRPNLSKTSNILREGRVMAEIVDDQNNSVANFSIPQKYIDKEGINSQGHASTFKAPVDPHESISSFLLKDELAPNTFSVSKDIARIVLSVFCDYQYKAEDLISHDPTYIENLENLTNKLLSGELRVKVIGSRIYRFGQETLSALLPRGNFDPMKIFSREIYDSNNLPTGKFESLFVPMLLAMQVAETGRRFIVFHNRIHYNTLGVGKPYSLREYSDTLSKEQPLRTQHFNN